MAVSAATVILMAHVWHTEVYASQKESRQCGQTIADGYPADERRGVELILQMLRRWGTAQLEVPSDAGPADQMETHKPEVLSPKVNQMPRSEALSQQEGGPGTRTR